MDNTQNAVRTGYRDISPELHRFEKVNDAIEGTFALKDAVTIQGRTVQRAWLTKHDGNTEVILLTKQLDPIFATLLPGTEVMVIYKGSIQLDDVRSVKKFQVLVPNSEPPKVDRATGELLGPSEDLPF